MTQKNVNEILSEVGQNLTNFDHVSQFDGYTRLSDDERAAFEDLDVVQARTFLKSASERNLNVQKTASLVIADPDVEGLERTAGASQEKS